MIYPALTTTRQDGELRAKVAMEKLRELRDGMDIETTVTLPISLVYFMLSLEECLRLGISIVVFRRKKWMQSLEP